MPDDSKLETIPVGRLGIIAMESCTELGKKVDNYLGELSARTSISLPSHFMDMSGILI